MPLTAGTRLGPYEVVAPIGAGGMGEVYRARDARLQRDVAVKVLPDDVARDADRRARFEREAQAVAALSHPNVLAIFDTGSHEGRLYAVTELLDGETLRVRLQRGPVPIRKAIDWAVQIARGLGAAHAKELVHRDLKPENIFLVKDGQVKILDFGLARPIVSSTESETAGAVTGDGVVLGTVGYMAPEQVRGQTVDARADLFAFGAVLYEMLTGARAFQRDTPAETMTAILRDEPADLAGLRADVPPALDRIVRHCLEKNPHERFQSARDVAFALEALSGSAAGTTSTQVTTAAAPEIRRPSVGRLVVGVTIVASLIIVGLAFASRYDLFSPRSSSTAPAIVLGAATQVTADDGLEIDAALSPDGKLLAYSAGQATGMRIFIRPVAGGRTLTLSEGGSALEFQPRWSPDGSQILFLTPDGAFVASSLGGTSKRIAPAPVTSAAWAPDGKTVVIARDTSLASVAPDGTERSLVTGAFQLHSCVHAPLGGWVACVSGNLSSVLPGAGFGNIAPSAVVIAPAAGGPLAEVTDKTTANVSPVWSPDGRHLYFVSNREGPRDIYVVEVDGTRPTIGAPRRVTTGLGVQSIAFAGSGDRLAYVTYAARANIWSLPIPAGAAVDTSRAQSLTSSNQVVESIRLSRDRTSLLFDSTLHLNAEIFWMPIGGGPPQRLTTNPADDFAPDLSPDGHELAFHSWRSGSRDIYVKLVDGGADHAVTAGSGHESYPKWSPDGAALSYVDQDSFLSGDARGRLFVVRRTDGKWGAPVLVRDGASTMGVWLPDARTLAYPREGGIELIPADGGASQAIYRPAAGDPRARSLVASEDGRTLYFKSADAEGRSRISMIWSVPVTGGKPRLLVRFADPARPSIRPDFDVGAGRIFFTLEDRQADIWVAEVTRR